MTTIEPPSGSEGFILDEVEMKGFMRYVERTDPPLRFPDKFTVITGRTGAGKSTILDAITFGLYGSTVRTDIQSVKTSDVCRPGGYVRIGFRQGDSRWDVKRGFTTKKESYLEVVRDGESVQGTIHEKERTIQEVVGLDYVGFRNSTFVRQEEMKDLGAARGADRLAVFQKLFRLEVFEKALEQAKEELVARQGDLREKEADIAARTEALQRLPALRGELAEASKALESRTSRVAQIEARIRDGEDGVQRLREEREAWVRASSARDEGRAHVEGLRKRLDSLRAQAKETEALEARRAALEARVGDLDLLREEMDRLRERSEVRNRVEMAAESAVKLFEQAKRDHETRRDRVKDKIDALHRKIVGLRTDLDRDEAFNFLRDEGRLEERVARIAKELEWLSERGPLVRELEAERARTEKALERVRTKVGSIDGDSFVLTELRRQVEDLKEELRKETEESHRILAPLDDEKIGALRAVDAAPWSDADARRLEGLAKAVREKAADRKALDDLAARLWQLGDLRTLERDLGAQRENAERDLAGREAEVLRLEPGAGRYGKAEEDLARLRKEADAERKALHTAEGQVEQLRRHIGDLEGDETRMKTMERERAGIRARIEVYDVLVGRIFHKRGVVMYAVDQILPELEIEASKNLSELTAGRFHRIKLETYEEGRGHGIRIRVQGVDGAWHDVGEFSGGEKTQINAALRFAIAKELASLPQVGRTFGRMKTLFIDEGDLGSLDTEVSRELFVQKLFRMGEFFEKVILITHLAEVAERFPGRLRVTMTPSQESRVEVLA